MSNSPSDFLDHLLLAMPGFSGKVLVLDAFFDDTKVQLGPRTAGAAGVLFDKDSLATFNAGWAPHAAGLPGQYRTATMHGGYRPFDVLSYAKRQELLRTLARLIAKTRDAGFTATVDLAHYEALKADQPRVAAAAGAPYTVALMGCLERVGQHMRAHFPSEEVYYWFEAGNGQAEANDFVRRAYKNPKTRERFHIAGWSFITKDKALALCAADFLAWEWQRNYTEGVERELAGQDGGPWRENFKLLFDGPNAKPIYGYTMGRGRTEVRALINMFYALDRD